MRKSEFLFLIFIFLFFFSIYWFWGREPYILFAGDLSDPDLLYVEPKWNGWHKSGLTFLDKIPPEFKEIYPQAKGWWYVKRQISDIPDNLINLEDTIEESFEKLEKYYKWKPLGISK